MSVLVHSTVLPTYHADLAVAQAGDWFSSLGTVALYNQTYTWTGGNDSPSPQGRSFTNVSASGVFTPVTIPQIGAGNVTIDFPVRPPGAGVITGIQWLIAGDVTYGAAVKSGMVQADGGVGVSALLDQTFPVLGFTAPSVQAKAPGFSWTMLARGLHDFPTPLPPFPFAPSDNTIVTLGSFGTYTFLNGDVALDCVPWTGHWKDDTETDILHSDDNSTAAHASNLPDIVAWVEARWGTSGNAVTLTFDAPVAPFIEAIPNPAAAGTHMAGSVSCRRTFSNLRLILNIRFRADDTNPQTKSAAHPCIDHFPHYPAANPIVVATAFFGAVSGATMPLYIAVHRSIQKNIGSGAGSTLGWETYKLMDVDKRSELGLHFLETGVLCVQYETFDSNGNPTAVHKLCSTLGAGGAASWGAELPLDPNRAQTISVGSGQAQGFRLTMTT